MLPTVLTSRTRRALLGSAVAFVLISACSGPGSSPEPLPEATASPATTSSPTPELPPTPTPSPIPEPDPEPEPTPFPQAIASYRWVERSDGPSLFVDPTEWTRKGGLPEWEAAWAELIALVPEAETQSMYEQFICHAVGAPAKETWNLEPWREAIGLVPLMMAECNN